MTSASSKLIADRLGWLDLPTSFADRVVSLEAFAIAVREEGFTAGLVCGMGGSSLAPDVLASSLPRGETGIPVRILDSTDPTAVQRATTRIRPGPDAVHDRQQVGHDDRVAGLPGPLLEGRGRHPRRLPARPRGRPLRGHHRSRASVDAIPHSDLFRETFLNPADVGGRYSALSYVGLVPAALMGSTSTRC